MSWVYNLRAQDPNSDIARVIGISLVFSIVAFLAVCLRFYGRSRTRRTLWLDDYAVLSSSILTLVYAGITVAREFAPCVRNIEDQNSDRPNKRRDGGKD
jgi:hypothetical protein